MNLSFTDLEPSIKQQLETAKILKPATVKKLITTVLLPHKDRFLAVEAVTGVPALWLMPVWYRESPSFDTYLGNGDSLNKPTVHVPKGRGPFSTWEDGVIDTLTLDHIIHEVEEWTWARSCWQWESFNGFGPRLHGRTSGYVWSGTDQYQGGKYIADGVWSRGTYDKQLGCFAIAQMLASKDADLVANFNDNNKNTNI